MFNRDEDKFELWEVKFLGYTRLQKLCAVISPKLDDNADPDEGRTLKPSQNGSVPG